MSSPHPFGKMRLGAVLCSMVWLATPTPSDAGFLSTLVEHAQAHLGRHIADELNAYLNDKTRHTASPAVPPAVLRCAVMAMKLDATRAKLDEARASLARAPIGTTEFRAAIAANQAGEQSYGQSVRDYNSRCP